MYSTRGGSGHLTSGKSSSKKIIQLLIDLALFNAAPTLVPEVKLCESDNHTYRLHTATQISRQPSQVNKSKGNTLDVFTTLIGGMTTRNEKASTSFPIAPYHQSLWLMLTLQLTQSKMHQNEKNF